jgi:hypothetical protein
MKNYTKEEIESSYHFRVLKKILKSEFEWITDLFVNEEYLETFNTIFLMSKIDYIKFCEIYDTKISKFMLLPKSSTLTRGSLSYIFDITFDDAKDIEEDIDNLIKYVKNSPIPDDLKLDRNRQNFSLHDFIIDESVLQKIPKQYFE